MTLFTSSSAWGSSTFGAGGEAQAVVLDDLALASVTACSITSAMTDLPYSDLRWDSGTLPGRKPLIRPCP